MFASPSANASPVPSFKSLFLFAAATLLFVAMGARAQLVIEITQGVDDPTPIAVVPFAWEGAEAPPEDLRY